MDFTKNNALFNIINNNSGCILLLLSILFIKVGSLNYNTQTATNNNNNNNNIKKNRNPKFVDNPDPLFGRHKWLGGSLSGDGKSIIGVPSHSKHIIKIIPNYNTDDSYSHKIMTFGGPYIGQFKWLRGVLCGNNIYCIPSHATTVLKIDSINNNAKEIGELPRGKWKWHGAALASNGCIYGVPCNAQTILKIDTNTDEVTLIGDVPAGGQKWYGALLGSDGCVYGIPYKAKGVLKINPFTDTVSVIGNFNDDYKWHGGAVGRDGCIYAFPAHAETVLKIIPHLDDSKVQLEELQLDSSQEDQSVMKGKYKWLGGGVDREGNIYGMPSDSQAILKIIPNENKVTTFCNGVLSDEHNKWQGAVCGSDGNLYAIPADAKHILQINPYNSTINLIGDLPKGKDKWQGGFVGSDGVIYGIPEHANYILKINTSNNDNQVEIIDSSKIEAPGWKGSL